MKPTPQAEASDRIHARGGMDLLMIKLLKVKRPCFISFVLTIIPRPAVCAADIDCLCLRGYSLHRQHFPIAVGGIVDAALFVMLCLQSTP